MYRIRSQDKTTHSDKKYAFITNPDITYESIHAVV